MFSCALHNWFSYDFPCPACQKEITSTTNIIINTGGTNATEYHPEDTIKQLQQTLKEKDEEIKRLQSTCLAAAEEIQSKWDAHCDEQGYGCVSLMRRLENGVGGYYSGYNAGQFEKLQQLLSEKEKEIELLKQQKPIY